jgi:hypothetical protein
LRRTERSPAQARSSHDAPSTEGKSIMLKKRFHVLAALAVHVLAVFGYFDVLEE